MKKTLEQQYKEETGLNAYEPNNMRPNIPEDVYVEWLEDKIEQLALCNVSKRDLGNHLAEIIKECSEGMSKEQVNSQGWIWLASKKTLAESILIQFC